MIYFSLRVLLVFFYLSLSLAPRIFMFFKFFQIDDLLQPLAPRDQFLHSL